MILLVSTGFAIQIKIIKVNKRTLVELLCLRLAKQIIGDFLEILQLVVMVLPFTVLREFTVYANLEVGVMLN